MNPPKRYTVTAALPYANGSIHIGHLAGVYLPADIYARYLRIIGKDVAFISGSDEYGFAIPMKAKQAGVSPKKIVDKYHSIIKKSFDEFGISFDNYSRTSSNIHIKTASDFFTKLYRDGVFEEKFTDQLYDKEANQFLADRFVIGTCPKCGFEESYGDQCESCGTNHDSIDLINPKSMLTGSQPIPKATKHWFLPLNKYEDFLKNWALEDHKKDWKPNVYGQVKGWLDDGLKSRAVTRDSDWGVSVPLKNVKNKVLYVWFEAPVGYISSTKEWAKREGKNWEDYWKKEDTKLVHFIGKDNIVFHCIIFPAMLKAHGEYILPSNVPANEFLNLEGSKLSTSKNWAAWLIDYLKEFPGKQDVLRYVLTVNAPESKDNNFTWKNFQERNNSELVAIFGNFINRVVVLINKFYDGTVPSQIFLTRDDESILIQIKEYPNNIGKSIEEYKFREGIQKLMNLARLGNKYLAKEEPWKKIKDDEERARTIMFVGLQISTALSIVSEPFLPFTSAKLKSILNLDKSLSWNDVSVKNILLPQNHKISKGELLFSKIDDEAIEYQFEKLKDIKVSNDGNRG